MSITIERIFQLPIWDEFTRFKMIDFWSRRRIEFSESSENTLKGKRGSLLGNITSFDMSKLMSELTITISAENRVHCELEVNTFMQIITEYNKAWWNLEMETFESYLLQTDEQDERWRRFKAIDKKAAIAWTLTSGLVGNKIPPEEKP
jgi:hypothetical protein